MFECVLNIETNLNKNKPLIGNVSYIEAFLVNVNYLLYFPMNYLLSW